MTSLTVGIVGCGRMGQERARSAAAAGARIVFVHDLDGAQATALAAQHPGCRALSGDSPASLVPQDLGALFICSPPSARGPVELAAIAHRIPFFVEKPLGLSSSHVRHVLDRLDADAPALVHAVGYQNRVRSSVQQARRILAGRTVLAISAFWAGRKYRVPWWLRTDDSGGPINEQATHLVDLCRFLCGEIADIGTLRGSAADPGTSDTEEFSAAVALRFDCGAFGSLFYSCEANDKQIAIHVITQDGGLALTSWDLALTHNAIDGSGLCDQQEDIFVRETRQFLEAVAAGNPGAVACTYRDAMQTQHAVDQLRAASNQFRSVA